ncbi:MAG: hypothetical protein KatS3mg044_0022 [Rhodothermaceae bacterium]|nr:MAG: GMP synthase [Bacteroidota bacterium]GIV61156.1 MAG: hypothetical protein KatS3mg044_0022 [Rhodothermaceae bacterium]
MSTPENPVRVAVLDLYNNEPNEGMRAIRQLLTAADRRYHDVPVTFDVYEARYRGEVPGLDYDVYISSGGPGSPFDGEGQPWEAAYFTWLERVWAYNHRTDYPKKYVFFICHSFQMMCRFFELAEVTRRRSPSFGILPVHMTDEGRRDWLFEGLPDPFYAADFRSWQVIQPHRKRFEKLGARILALEKIRPHVDLERAIMAIRLSEEMVGTQFHPEADPPGMIKHFLKPERKAYVIEHHGEEKYKRILRHLQEPNALTRTHDAILPNFLRRAITHLRPEQALRRVA